MIVYFNWSAGVTSIPHASHVWVTSGEGDGFIVGAGVLVWEGVGEGDGVTKEGFVGVNVGEAVGVGVIVGVGEGVGLGLDVKAYRAAA